MKSFDDMNKKSSICRIFIIFLAMGLLHGSGFEFSVASGATPWWQAIEASNNFDDDFF